MVKNLISTDEAYLKLFQRHLPAETNHIIDGGKINTANTIRFMIDPSILLRGPSMAYIYSDIVEYQYLGDSKARYSELYILIKTLKSYHSTISIIYH